MIDPITPEPPVAVDRPVMVQEWNTLTSLHWAYDPEVVQATLPPSLTVDTFDGAAWVGLIPFSMEGIRFRRGPAIPWFGTFPETNVRTYVVDPAGRRNVWFHSLDINRLPPTVVARARYGLPYCWGSASIDRDGDRVTYRNRRRWPGGGAAATVVVDVGAPIADDDVLDLHHFVSARWGMSTTRSGRVLHGTVDHPRWPLHEATLIDLDESLLAAAGLPAPDGPPLVLYSPGVEVRIGTLEQVDTDTERQSVD